MLEPDGITFNGTHIGELDAAILMSKWPGAAAVTANTASVSGRDGTLRYEGQTYGEKSAEGTIYILSPDDETLTDLQMLERADDLTAWLQPGGRKRLIFDAMPERFYMAEILHEIQFSTDEWSNGAADLTFTLQPFSYALREAVATATLATETPQAKTLTLPGNLPAPVQATVTATGAVSRVQIALGDSLYRLENLALESGDMVEIAADIAIGETLTVRRNGVAARGYLTAESAVPLTAQPGNNALTLSADGACTVGVHARGRWKR